MSRSVDVVSLVLTLKTDSASLVPSVIPGPLKFKLKQTTDKLKLLAWTANRDALVASQKEMETQLQDSNAPPVMLAINLTIKTSV